MSKKKEAKNIKTDDNSKKVAQKDYKEPKYGPMPTFPNQRLFTRTVIVVTMVIIVYFTSNTQKNSTFADLTEVNHRTLIVPCSKSYTTDIAQFPKCIPEHCGRVVTDKLVNYFEIKDLLNFAKEVFQENVHAGGATIIDIHNGIISYQNKHAKIPSESFNSALYNLFNKIKFQIQSAVAHHFGVDAKAMYLTHPTFFSKLNKKEPQTIHDEYWHEHVDKETYPSFHYTTLLYLSTYKDDFQGGRLFFVSDKGNSSVQPKWGRVVMFTSGEENPHFVERVTQGDRFALTISFTCNPMKSIQHPQTGRLEPTFQ